jgi:hypothetical protein
MMLALTDNQLGMIMQAAALVGPDDRQKFLRSVASQLTSQQPSDPELAAALVWILQNRSISVGPELFLEHPIKEKLKCKKQSKAKKILTETF